MATGRDTHQRQRSQRFGRRAELLASMVLMLKGHRIIERRFKSPVGEIDLIARRNRTYVFVEVKARRSLASAAESISGHQRGRIVRAAEHWLALNPRAALADLRFDAILIGRGIAFRHFKDAFRG